MLLLLLFPFVLVKSLVFVFRNLLIAQMLLDLLKHDTLKNEIIDYIVVKKIVIQNIIKRTKETLGKLPEGTSSANSLLLKTMLNAAKCRELFFEKKLDYLILNIEKFIKINLVLKIIYLILIISMQGFSVYIFCLKFREVLSFLSII